MGASCTILWGCCYMFSQFLLYTCLLHLFLHFTSCSELHCTLASRLFRTFNYLMAIQRFRSRNQGVLTPCDYPTEMFTRLQSAVQNLLALSLF